MNKPLCRWMAAIGAGLFAWFAASYVTEGGDIIAPVLFGALGFLIGGIVVLSLKSTDW